jgi:hypothetical protein
MKVLRWLVLALAAAVCVAFLVAIAARSSDGPIGPFPGGPLHGGPLVTNGDVNWSGLADVREVQLQLVTPPRSRTTWFLVYDGRPYVPCAFPTHRFLKQWPHEALRDGRVVVRVAGQRYERQAVRVTDPAEWHALASLSQAKYGHGAPSYPDGVWYFRLEPRPSP